MYEKARFFGDRRRAEDIMNCTDPKKMKMIGREVNGFDDKRWQTVSLRVGAHLIYFIIPCYLHL